MLSCFCSYSVVINIPFHCFMCVDFGHRSKHIWLGTVVTSDLSVCVCVCALTFFMSAIMNGLCNNSKIVSINLFLFIYYCITVVFVRMISLHQHFSLFPPPPRDMNCLVNLELHHLHSHGGSLFCELQDLHKTVEKFCLRGGRGRYMTGIELM